MEIDLNKNSYRFFIIYSFLVLTLISCSNQELNKTDWDEYNLIGKVKSYRESIHEAHEKFGEVQIGDRIEYLSDNEYQFNANGNITEHTYYKYGPMIESKYIYKYTDSNILEESNYYDENGDLERKTKFEYDQHLNLTERIDFNFDNQFIGKETFKYDDQQNLIEMNWINADSTVDERIVFINEDSNKLKTTITYDNKGEIKDKRVSTFDDNENLMERKWYNSSGVLYRTYVIKRDDLGNEIELRIYAYNNPDELFKIKAGDSLIKSYTYEFDMTGNWIEKVEYDNDHASTAQVREITYY